MKISFLTVLISCLIIKANSQVLRTDHIIDKNSGGFIEFSNKQPESEVTSVYMYDSWFKGKLMLKTGQQFHKVPMKIDLKNSLVEVQTEKGIKVAPFRILSGFTLEGESGTNEYVFGESLNNSGLTGVLQQLIVGKVSVYRKVFVDVLPPNYNPALNIGSQTAQYVKKEKIFLIKNGTVTDVAKAGKKTARIFDSHQDEIKTFVKDNRLSFKKQEDLIQIVSVYNKLAQNG